MRKIVCFYHYILLQDFYEINRKSTRWAKFELTSAGTINMYVHRIMKNGWAQNGATFSPTDVSMWTYVVGIYKTSHNERTLRGASEFAKMGVGSATPCVSPPTRPSIFSNYSFSCPPPCPPRWPASPCTCNGLRLRSRNQNMVYGLGVAKLFYLWLKQIDTTWQKHLSCI
jgi:hypothetical protein